MKSQNPLLNHKKEYLIVKSKKRRGDFNADTDRDMIFSLERSQKRREAHEKEEENFMSRARTVSVLSPRQELKRDLFWFFVKYFFKQSNIPLKKFMAKMEKIIILNALFEVNGGQKKASEMLGLKYTTLNEKVKKYGIRVRK
jgi:DNA-binding NtrC family response regulator